MRICLVDGTPAPGVPGEGADYVAELGPVLAESHAVTIVTVGSGLLGSLRALRRLRTALAEDRPDVVHVNNVSGWRLALLLLVIRETGIVRPALALGIHGESLLARQLGLNRRSTRAFGLVVSPSASLLDRHLAQNFFANAIHDVIPYEMPYHASRLMAAYRRLLATHRAGNLGDRAA
jgi:Glycosyl transferase 4-like domain